MNEMILINYDSDRPTVLGRDLHKVLKIKTEYKKWFSRMCEYGFDEGIDFLKVTQKCLTSTTGQNIVDHQLTIPMAKEICMIQRTDIGKKYRQYFIAVEDKWNDPDAVMARALQIANKKLDEVKMLIAAKDEEIAEMKPKVSYYDVILNCKDLVSVTQIAKDYGKSAKWLNEFLSSHKIQYKQGDQWFLYQKYAAKGYAQSKTQSFAGKDGEPHSKAHTYWTQDGRRFIYELLKNEGILPVVELE